MPWRAAGCGRFSARVQATPSAPVTFSWRCSRPTRRPSLSPAASVPDRHSSISAKNAVDCTNRSPPGSSAYAGIGSCLTFWSWTTRNVMWKGAPHRHSVPAAPNRVDSEGLHPSPFERCLEHYSKPHVIEKKKSARAASNASW